jgi:hypothetical protein
MKLSEELLDDIDGSEESTGRDSRLTRWADMAAKLEGAALPAGFSITRSDTGPWFNFEGNGRKASLNLAAIMERDSSHIIKSAVMGWIESYQSDVGI